MYEIMCRNLILEKRFVLLRQIKTTFMCVYNSCDIYGIHIIIIITIMVYHDSSRRHVINLSSFTTKSPTAAAAAAAGRAPIPMPI